MKRNLLIGTSLVAAFATTSLDARSFSVMTEKARNENTALSSAVFTVTEGHKQANGKTALKAGETAGVFAEVYNAAVAKLKAGKVDAKVTVDDVVKALVTNPEVRKIVDGRRDAVVAAVKAKQAEAKAKAVADAKAKAKIAPTPDVKVIPAPEVETTVETLGKAARESTDAYKEAINAETAAKSEALTAAYNVVAATYEKAAEEKAFKAVETTANELAVKAAEAKAAAEKAATDLKALEAKLAAEMAKRPDAETAKSGKASDSDEALAFNKLTIGIQAIEADIAIATKTKADAVAADAAAKAEAETAEANLTRATKARDAAVEAFEAAEAAKKDADTAEGAKTTAVTEAETKFDAAAKAYLAAAEKAAKEAAEKATSTAEATAAAKLRAVELETAVKIEQAKFDGLKARVISIEAELTAARAAAAENSTEATKAAVKAKEDASIAIAKEVASAKITLEHAKQAKTTADTALTKAVEESEKAAAKKESTAEELKEIKPEMVDIRKKFEAYKAEAKKRVEAAAAVNQARKAGLVYAAANDNVAAIKAELDALEAKKATDTSTEAKQLIAAKRDELKQARKEAADADLALRNAERAAYKAQLALRALAAAPVSSAESTPPAISLAPRAPGAGAAAPSRSAPQPQQFGYQYPGASLPGGYTGGFYAPAHQPLPRVGDEGFLGGNDAGEDEGSTNVGGHGTPRGNAGTSSAFDATLPPQAAGMSGDTTVSFGAPAPRRADATPTHTSSRRGSGQSAASQGTHVRIGGTTNAFGRSLTSVERVPVALHGANASLVAAPAADDAAAATKAALADVAGVEKL
jgi:hypothetical protein